MKVGNFVKQGLLNQVASFFSNKETFNHYKGVVARLADKNMSGAEKRTLAFQELESLGVTIAGWVANLLLELAVAYLKLAK